MEKMWYLRGVSHILNITKRRNTNVVYNFETISNFGVMCFIDVCENKVSH